MGLVVDDDDVPLVAELPANAVDHLGGGLVEVGAENLLGQLVGFDQLPDLESVEVGDEDLRPAELPDQVGGNEVAEPVVVLGVVGIEYPKPVADRDPRGDDEEGVGEPAVLRVGDLVQSVPGDEHGHDDRLARAGRHLHRDAGEPWVRSLVGLSKPVGDPVVADLLGGFGQVDERLQGFDLAEEELVLPVGVGPVLQELASDLGDSLVSPFPPVLDPFPDAVDLVVGLDAILGPLRVKLELLALLLGRRNRHEVSTLAPALDDLVGDSLVGEPPMAIGFAIGRVEDRVLDDGIRHGTLRHFLDRRSSSQTSRAESMIQGRKRPATFPGSWKVDVLFCYCGPGGTWPKKIQVGEDYRNSSPLQPDHTG